MRTIIDLPEDQLRALAEICGREKISRAEAIRRAVHAYVERHPASDASATFGLWRDRGVDALRYQRRARSEWSRAEPPEGTGPEGTGPEGTGPDNTGPDSTETGAP